MIAIEECPSISETILGFTLREQKRGTRVPEVVKTGVGGEHGALEEAGERAVAEVGGVDGAAGPVGEDDRAEQGTGGPARGKAHAADSCGGF
ncbi:MAG: hypothetical protein H0T57_16910 [Rubrobacter sp.]|nr:hypothetical protein [Rubrobacter sp.]